MGCIAIVSVNAHADPHLSRNESCLVRTERLICLDSICPDVFVIRWWGGKTGLWPAVECSNFSVD
jgi:hypothetical protein